VVLSQRCADKIRDKHGLDPDQVVRLVQSPPPREGRYVHDDERGTRLLIMVNLDQQGVLAVLRPLGDDAWRLVSAYVLKRRRRA
jgi:hypothetical protein